MKDKINKNNDIKIIFDKKISKYKNLDLNLEYLKDKYVSGKSSIDLAKIFDVSYHTILNRLNKMNIKIRKKPTNLHKKKISDTLKRKGIQPKERYTGEVWNKGKKGLQVPWNKNLVGVQKSNKKGKTFEELYGEEKTGKIKEQIKEARKYQVMPVKDTKIEVKMQNFLKQLEIEFYTHQYMKEIEHGYQCDILIPKQEGIIKKTIIECFGVYWHNYPYAREIDIQRCSELREKGWRVLVFWENEIKLMHLNNLKEKLVC